MKDIICRTVLAVMLAAISAGASFGQDYVSTPVEISKEKVKIDGRICYSHIVLERQTLYSISKAYGVSVDEIHKFNPSIKESGLKKNSIIIIPSQEVAKAAPQTQAQTKPQTQPQTLQQPQTVTPAPVKNEQNKPVRVHIAKWYEDLDVIAAQYGVKVEDIMKANNLKGRRLEKRQKLIIPYPDENIEPVAETKEEIVVTEPEVIIKETEEVTDSIATATATPRPEVKATILLPLTNAEGEPNRNNMDFYCGALLAVYDMAEKGTDCKLSVYDTMNSETTFNAQGVSEGEIVIGPVSSADLTRLLNAIDHRVPVISPLDPRVERMVENNSNLIQIPTPQQLQYKDLVKWIEEEYSDGDRVVMITEKGARQTGISAYIKEALDSTSLAYNTFSYSILEGRDVTEALTELMSLEGRNRIVVGSESEAFVNDVIRNLNLLIYNNLDIVLYAPSKVRSFETIEVDNLHKTSMHVSLAYHIDYENADVKDFIKKYRALYNTEPNQFAFQGYDIASYFINLYSLYGKDWKDKMEDTGLEMLQSTFNIRKSASGGYVNNGVRRIIYDNGYTVRKVK